MKTELYFCRFSFRVLVLFTLAHCHTATASWELKQHTAIVVMLLVTPVFLLYDVTCAVKKDDYGQDVLFEEINQLNGSAIEHLPNRITTTEPCSL